MPPDLNSLPPSPLHSPAASNGASRTHSPSASRTMAASPPHSLAATATMNAGMQNEETRRPSSGSMRREVERARRRSSIRMNLNLNDPAVPAPGEMQRSPYSPHDRTHSLGELHQELEYEQEGQVNRLLSMIRQQQAQISTLQANQQQTSSSAVDDSTPTSERSMSLSHPAHTSQAGVSPLASATQPRSHSPFALGNISRQSSFADRSRGGSHTGSPSLRPLSGQTGAHDYHDLLSSSASSRDESAFYQAETMNLTRENQMLKQRIRELERQLAEMNTTGRNTTDNSNPAASRDRADQPTSQPSASAAVE